MPPSFKIGDTNKMIIAKIETTNKEGKAADIANINQFKTSLKPEIDI